MSSIGQSVEKVFTTMTSKNSKVVDLQRDILEPRTSQPLTTDHGVKVADTDNWLKIIGSDSESKSESKKNGPSLLEDQIGREKIHRFDHERIPERVVHARGTGAHGHFKVFDDRASKYTFAPVLTDSSRTTPVFVRFSTVQGSRGSAVRICFFFCAYNRLKSPVACRTPSAMSEGLRSSSILKKATGTSSEMTFPFSSFRMPLNSLTSFTL